MLQAYFRNVILFTALRKLEADNNLTLDELLAASAAHYKAEDEAKAAAAEKAEEAKTNSKLQKQQEEAARAGRNYFKAEMKNDFFLTQFSNLMRLQRFYCFVA